MQKVYLLLRNNQQTGPYSFEELLQLHLKPLDLVWVEGKSYGWRYPAEIESLKQFFITPGEATKQDAGAPSETPTLKTVETVSSTSVNPPKKVFVSLPSNGAKPTVPKQPTIDPIEEKAEELRKRAQAYIPQQEPLQTNYSRKLQDAEEEYTQWVYQQKTKKKTGANKNLLLVVGISVVIVFGGWWAFNHFSTTSGKPLAVKQTNEETIQDSAIAEPTTTNEPAATEITSTSKLASSSFNNPVAAKKEIIKSNSKEKKSTVQEQTTTPVDVIVPSKQTEKIVDNSTATDTEKEEVSAIPAEKKKTLKEKVGELFKKRKTDSPAEEPQTRSVENSNGERTATKRNDNPESNSVITDVSDLVEIKTNKIADSWMMGVKNLKLTLYNRSDLTINAAKVEVLYYSEQNNLLEKRILSFSNIPPKKSQTVAAPDQRLADHIEYKVISATGTENAYAKK